MTVSTWKIKTCKKLKVFCKVLLKQVPILPVITKERTLLRNQKWHKEQFTVITAKSAKQLRIWSWLKKHEYQWRKVKKNKGITWPTKSTHPGSISLTWLPSSKFAGLFSVTPWRMAKVWLIFGAGLGVSDWPTDQATDRGSRLDWDYGEKIETRTKLEMKNR